MANNGLSFRSSRVVYRGPQVCSNCGVRIVKMADEFGGNAFTYPSDPILPNTEWHVHICDPAAALKVRGDKARDLVRGGPHGCFTRAFAARVPKGWIIIAGPGDSKVLTYGYGYADSASEAWVFGDLAVRNGRPMQPRRTEDTILEQEPESAEAEKPDQVRPLRYL